MPNEAVSSSPQDNPDIGQNIRKEWIVEAAARAKEKIYGKGFDPLIKLFSSSTEQNFGRRMGSIIPRIITVIESSIGQGSEDEVEMLGFSLIAMIYADLVRGKIIKNNPAMLISAFIWSKLEWMSGNPDRVDPQRMMQQAQAGQVPGIKQGLPASTSQAGVSPPAGQSQGLLSTRGGQ